MNVTVRPAIEDDKQKCLALLHTLSATTGGTSSRDAGKVFDLLLDATRGQVFVAEDANDVLGMASVSFNLAMRYGREYCQLEELIVDPAARGKNVGAALVEATLRHARERGCTEYGLYLLESTEHNRPFYEKFGFLAIGTEMRQTLI